MQSVIRLRRLRQAGRSAVYHVLAWLDLLIVLAVGVAVIAAVAAARSHGL